MSQKILNEVRNFIHLSTTAVTVFLSPLIRINCSQDINCHHKLANFVILQGRSTA